MNRIAWNQRYAGDATPAQADPHLRLETEVSSLRPGRALDLACGNGRNAVWLATRGWQVTGVDFAEVAISQAAALAERCGVEVDWIVEDLLDYRPQAASFDLVTLLFCQLPQDERRRVIESAAAAVAPGGTFLLAAHHPRNLLEGTRGPRDPAVLYGPEEVAAQLGGFVVDQAACVERLLETAEGRGRQIDTVVRARRQTEA
jgi:SAM-dependent methyltransferase